jgi:hypothetical protein
MHAEYNGGNMVRLTVEFHDGNTLEQANVTVTMTELRAMMDELEASYREKSCCPSCGTLTYGEGMCDDCKRYEESKQGFYSGINCYHGVPLHEFCYQCDDDNR